MIRNKNGVLKPYLIEVNHTPSFQTDSLLDYQIKKNLIIDTINVLQLSQCDRSKWSRQKRRNKNQQESVDPDCWQWSEIVGGYCIIYTDTMVILFHYSSMNMMFIRSSWNNPNRYGMEQLIRMSKKSSIINHTLISNLILIGSQMKPKLTSKQMKSKIPILILILILSNQLK